MGEEERKEEKVSGTNPPVIPLVLRKVKSNEHLLPEVLKYVCGNQV